MEKNGQESKIEEMPLDMGNRMLVDFLEDPETWNMYPMPSVLIGEVPLVF